MLIVLVNNKIDDNSTLYMGSHNLSQAAWGRKTKQHINVSNFEVGLLWGPQKGSKIEKEQFLKDIKIKFDKVSFDNNTHPYNTSMFN